MKTEFKSVIQLLEYYKDENKCKALLAQQRWGKQAVCPHCASAKAPYITNRGYKCSEKECGKKFTVTVGTVFENSKIKLRYWFAAIYLCTAHKKGISSHQLARDLGITQKSAWFVLHRVREMLQDSAPQMLSGVIEIDETFIGGKEMNRHTPKKQWKFGKKYKVKDKEVVLGILERNGRVLAKHLKDRKKETLIPIMVDVVEPGSTIYTDEYVPYKILANDYIHDHTKHGQKQYVRGRVHTNTIEGFWSLLKRGIDGIYHSVTPKHLQAYCNEYAYRYSTRKQSDNDRFFETLKNSGNFKLPYKTLIGKKGNLYNSSWEKK